MFIDSLLFLVHVPPLYLLHNSLVQYFEHLSVSKEKVSSKLTSIYDFCPKGKEKDTTYILTNLKDIPMERMITFSFSKEKSRMT